MAEPRPLRHAPIREALVDVRATPTRPILSQEQAFRDALRDTYPRFKQPQTYETKVEFAPGKTPITTTSAKPEGLQFISADERSLVQCRPNGFTFNRLSPYLGGDQLIAEALRVWSIYVRLALPAGVSRVALRFINNLALPTDKGHIRDFLDSPPATPPGGGRELQGFSNRLQAYDPDTGLTVIRTIASARARPGVLGVLIDIDAFRSADLGVEEADLRPVLESLRDLKNRVFFGSITDRTAVEVLN